MGTVQRLIFKWREHQPNITAAFQNMLQNTELVDVTLTCEGQSIRAHQLVLSACSPYFQSLFQHRQCPHPVIFLVDAHFDSLRQLVQYIYNGQVKIPQTNVSEFLRIAQALKIQGLYEPVGDEVSRNNSSETGSGKSVKNDQAAQMNQLVSELPFTNVQSRIKVIPSMAVTPVSKIKSHCTSQKTPDQNEKTCNRLSNSPRTVIVEGSNSKNKMKDGSNRNSVCYESDTSKTAGCTPHRVKRRGLGFNTPAKPRRESMPDLNDLNRNTERKKRLDIDDNGQSDSGISLKHRTAEINTKEQIEAGFVPETNKSNKGYKLVTKSSKEQAKLGKKLEPKVDWKLQRNDIKDSRSSAPIIQNIGGVDFQLTKLPHKEHLKTPVKPRRGSENSRNGSIGNQQVEDTNSMGYPLHPGTSANGKANSDIVPRSTPLYVRAPKALKKTGGRLAGVSRHALKRKVETHKPLKKKLKPLIDTSSDSSSQDSDSSSIQEKKYLTGSSSSKSSDLEDVVFSDLSDISPEKKLRPRNAQPVSSTEVDGIRANTHIRPKVTPGDADLHSSDMETIDSD